MGRWDEGDGATATPNNETLRCPIRARNITAFLYLRFVTSSIKVTLSRHALNKISSLAQSEILINLNFRRNKILHKRH